MVGTSQVMKYELKISYLHPLIGIEWFYLTFISTDWTENMKCTAQCIWHSQIMDSWSSIKNSIKTAKCFKGLFTRSSVNIKLYFFIWKYLKNYFKWGGYFIFVALAGLQVSKHSPRLPLVGITISPAPDSRHWLANVAVTEPAFLLF